MDTNVFLKIRIPDGSKMLISIVEGDTTPPGSFVAGVRMVLEDGSEVIVPDAEVHPGPKSKKLSSPQTYVWRARVEFTSKTVQTALIRAEVRKPDGALFGDKYEFPVTGQNGDDPQRATIFAATLLDADD